MKMQLRSVILSTSMVLGLVGVAHAEDTTAGRAAATTEESDAATQLVTAATGLERAFGDQFVAGNIDPAGLKDEIAQVMAAVPEEAREAVGTHIGKVLARAAQVAQDKTPEERQQLAYNHPASGEPVGSAQQAIILGAGFGGLGFGGLGFGGLGFGGLGRFGLGFGGFGGFGFPGMFPGAFGLNTVGMTGMGAFGFPGAFGAGGIGWGGLGRLGVGLW